MTANVLSRRSAFSMIELVIVVVIIGIIAAIAIPRMSRGATGAADAALQSNLSALRKAIDLYQTEHGSYPTIAKFTESLTQYSDITGTTFSTTKDGANGIIYGPYLREIPTLPVGADKGKKSVVATYAAGNGWVYDAAAGTIKANTAATELDDRGVKYSDY
jgi:general secretion pathway protein G